MSRVTSVETYWMALFLFWEMFIAHLPLPLSTFWLSVNPSGCEYAGLVSIATVNDTPHYAFSLSCSLLE